MYVCIRCKITYIFVSCMYVCMSEGQGSRGGGEGRGGLG